MASTESFVKDIFTGFCRTLFKVIGFGLGVVLLFIGMNAFFSGESSPHVTTVHVLPNDSWQTKPFSRQAPTILRIDVSGVIGLDRHIRKEEIKLQLMEAVDGHFRPGQLKGIFITVNSPGGSAEQSDAIYNYFKSFKARYNIPVVAFVDGMCASGGMYIACGADKIYSSQDSLIGHVGVLFSPPFFNVSTFLQKLGIQAKTLSAGKGKDNMNPFRPWNENETEQFQYIIDFMYNRFLDVVSENRAKLTREDLIDQGARLWPAPDAERLGYVDATFISHDEALKQFAQDLGVHDNYQYVILQHHDFIGELFGSTASFGIPNKIEHSIKLAGDIAPELCGQPLYLYHP
jgi:protease IV